MTGQPSRRRRQRSRGAARRQAVRRMQLARLRRSCKATRQLPSERRRRGRPRLFGRGCCSGAWTRTSRSSSRRARPTSSWSPSRSSSATRTRSCSPPRRTPINQSSLWLHMLSTSVWTLVCTVLATCRLALSIFDIKYLESHDIIEYMATYVQLQ